MTVRRSLSLAMILTFLAIVAAAQDPAPNPAFTISRATGPIVVDGDLADAAWKDAVRIDKWYETNPGDNVEPQAKSVGYLAYDDKYFYAGFDFHDPNPSQIRAPFNDRDRIGGNTDDYAGVILDTRNDGKTGILFLASPRGTLYDAVSDDASGEDSSPDLYWDAAGKITNTGWSLEIRIPFSSLRYEKRDVQEWGIMLYRNWPRDRRYQMFANRIPRGQNCFICNRNKLVGLSGLPAGGSIVAAPYVTARQAGETTAGLGTPLKTQPLQNDGGLDVKWTPNADTAIDATINPDFSQIESDVAVISTNERFAIFFPEKRPFFLEGVELLKTPINAVYTRSITQPRWGLRSTGKFSQNAYTVLVSQDQGGGSLILPSALGSDFAPQDFSSTVAIGRVRHDIGRSFVSFLGTTRESGDAHNRVIGPDFEWRIGKHNQITGQFLISDTKTPDRPDVTPEWNGNTLRGTALNLWWYRSTEKWDSYAQLQNFSDDFRADSGFVPQVGFRGLYTEGGRTFRPKGFFSRLRTYAFGQYDQMQDGSTLYRLLSAGIGADGKYRSFTRVRVARETFRSGNQLFDTNRLYYQFNFSVNRVISQLYLDGRIGDEVDFAHSRLGDGTTINFGGTLRPTDHLELGLTNGLRWLSVGGGRLFTSQVERLRATYTFTSKMFVRTIVQNQRTNRNRALYAFPVSQHSGSLTSELLFAYKLNWQTLLFLGAGDLREVTGTAGDFEPANRQVFMKISYAFQR